MIQVLRPYRLWLALMAAIILFAACQPRNTQPPVPQRVWTEYVSAHTDGLVSRRSRIVVRFSRDVSAPGEEAAAALQVSPKIEGQAVFTGPREITLTPSQPLPRGQEYKATLDPRHLKGVPESLAPYEFHFSVIAAQFEVSAAGLDAQPGDDNAMLLRGTLETADGEDDAVVAQMLGASYGGKPLALTWAHANEGRLHQFSASGIQRQARPAQLQLSWNGEPLGLKDGKGARSLEVPARGVFKVLDSTVQTEGRQSVIVRFSDALDANQNLSGLVTLGQLRLTANVEGNGLRVYTDQAATGELRLKVSEAVRNARGAPLGEDYETTLVFANEKPQVRFAGKGVILPENETLSIPLEGMNVQSLQVTAFQVFEDDIGQFLQVNNLSENNEIQRVGRVLWRKTIRLPTPRANQWTRYALDATELMRKHPGALFRLTLSINRSNSIYGCSAQDSALAVTPEDPVENRDGPEYNNSSGWDGIDEYYENYEGGGQPNWQERDDPCKDSYYKWAEGIRDERNFMASNIGLMAKRGAGGALYVAATRISDAEPLDGAELEVRNYQNQVIATGKTGGDGLARIELQAAPFYLLARAKGQAGYLKLNRGVALPVSHFDTGGETVKGGIKGFLYGERGVWRPGDDIHLTFVLEDRADRIPPNHPVTLQLFDPRGQLVKTVTNTEPVDDFYAFTLKTADDAPTGSWIAKVMLGGAEFSKSLKVETVMPNRLKMELKFPGESLRRAQMPLKSTLWAQWLHGAEAAGLKADVSARLVPVPTRFTRNGDFVFDDPARSYKGEPQTLFDGTLDAGGNAGFDLDLRPSGEAPGMLQAQFTTRVFEQGGAFSTGHSDYPYHPYERYVGMRLPKGDATRGMLLTDIRHPVELVTLDPDGKPAKAETVEINVYKIEWKWWWEKGQDNSAQFSQSSFPAPLYKEEVTLKDGKGIGHFEIKYPDWGRYLVRACDIEGGHCTGQVIYIDWPGWAGRAQDQAGPAASALNFSSDKAKYQAGETAVLQLPDAVQGRALLSIESGSRILSQRWVELEKGKTRIEVPLTAEMAPNVYASITLVQPHYGKDNDRPIRLYGVIPLEVSDPATHLAPQIKADKLWRPEGKVSVQVSEQQGREMTYTLAVVDEGLLGLTNYKTPDPHASFYQREALGVQTWDLFDDVAGAYGGDLERLLALGGDEGKPLTERKEQKRFPPVVRVLGPFHLGKGKTDRREIVLPQYIGEVRVMVVAGYRGAYGSAQQSVTVRAPLSLITTLPRVLGPGEAVTLPVSVFAYEPGVREVKLTLEADAKLIEAAQKTQQLKFDKPGEQMAYFSLKARERTGTAHVSVRAEGAGNRSASDIDIAVRAQNPAVATVLRKELEPGEEWKPQIKSFGVAGTASAVLEMSRVPPVNLDRRLQYLVQYPHGCLEQTTSSVFPQLYLDGLVQLDDGARKRIQSNVQAGIERLRLFQTGNQGFTYWPGQSEVNAWANNYAGHFLAEARKLGYQVPSAMFDGWVEFQRQAATRWAPNGFDSAENQAYRLLTLALADHAEVGAMNRLREHKGLSALARWNLAAAYAQIGLADAAREIMRGKAQAPQYPDPGETFGSGVRDDGVLLSTLVMLGDREQAQRVAERVAQQLGSEDWYSTQSTAYALLAMARYAGKLSAAQTFGYSYAENGGKPSAVSATKALSSQPLPRLAGGGELTVKNTSQQRLFARVVLRGSPQPGEEKAESEGLHLTVDYASAEGGAVAIAALPQGTDFVASVLVENRSGVALDDLALTQVVAGGWEIHNPRFESGEEQKPEALDYQDVRDDRVLSYFKLKPGESRRLRLLLNASYRGRYYLPAVSVESMYDARKHATTAGQWVEVTGGK